MYYNDAISKIIVHHSSATFEAQLIIVKKVVNIHCNNSDVVCCKILIILFH